MTKPFLVIRTCTKEFSFRFEFYQIVHNYFLLTIKPKWFGNDE
jgi:hypothetical protein